MPNYNYNLISGTHTNKKRKSFRTSTKKKEWMIARKSNPENWRTGFIKTSYCRRCGRQLNWKDGSYDFDHKYNNSVNNSQNNCYLICKSCHGKNTKVDKKKVKNSFGMVVGYKTYLKKVGYKKSRKKQYHKKRKARRYNNSYGIKPFRF